MTSNLLRNQNSKIYVYGIAGLKEDDILNEFRTCGRVLTCSMHGGYGFIEYEEEAAAKEAV